MITKGDWKASHPQDNHTAFISDNNLQQKVLMSVQWGSDIPEIEQGANGQLIARSPKMYEALMEFPHYVTASDMDANQILDRIREWRHKYWQPAVEGLA